MEGITPLVKLDLVSTNKRDATRELAELLFQAGDVHDLEEFVSDLETREAMMSTYCGYNLAIPHSESQVVQKASFAFGRSKGLEWDKDDEEVKFVIILAIPKTKEGEDNPHIEMMSSVATLALEDDIRKIWEEAETTEEIIKTFKP